MDHGFSIKTQGSGCFQILFQSFHIPEITEYRILGGDTCQPAGLEHLHSGVENFRTCFGSQGSHAGGVIFCTQSQRHHPGTGGCDALGIDRTQNRFNIAPQFRSSHGNPGGLFNFGDFLINPLHFLGMLYLGQPDGVRTGTDGCLQIFVNIRRIQSVDPNEDIQIVRLVVAHGFYIRQDFSDERYSPVFTPTVYPGMTVSMKLCLDQWNGNETPAVAPYIRTCSDKVDHVQGYIKLQQDKWIDVTFTIPDTNGDMIDEVGFLLESYTPKDKTLGVVYLDEFCISGKTAYTIDMAKQHNDFAAITPFSLDHGAWDLYGGTLNLMRCEPSFAYTGHYYAADYVCSAPVTPLNGTSHLLIARAQGAMRCYAGGLGSEGKLVLMKNDFGFQTLAECAFDWQPNQTYQITLTCKGNHISLQVDGVDYLQVEDDSFRYGMYGCGSLETGRTAFGNFAYRDL